MRKMAPLQTLFIRCLFFSFMAQLNSLLAKGFFISATVGNNTILRCASENDVKVGAKLYWYKQSLGMKPVLVSSYFKYDRKNEFHGEFYSSKRFTLDTDNEKNDLHIQNMRLSDSAVYHCVRCFLHQSEFLESVTVIVKSLNPTFEVHQSLHEDIEPGRSVILNCSVQTEHCDGPLRVHWFKQSEESAAGVLYSPGGDSSDQCESNTDSPTNSCVYNLLIHNVSSEQTGTYYCAVAACGHVLFGNGTRINIKDGVQTPTILVLSAALTFSSILAMLLAFSLCRLQKDYRSLSTEFKCQSRSLATTNREEQNVDSLHYAALNAQPLSRRQRVTVQIDCVYSSVQQG